jgi:hypothetical protein
MTAPAAGTAGSQHEREEPHFQARAWRFSCSC